MAVQERGHACELTLNMGEGPIEVDELVIPAGLTVDAPGTLVVVEGGATEATLVVREDGDPAL